MQGIGSGSRLINDMILGAGALHIPDPPKIEWFKHVRFIDVMISLIIPLFVLIAIAFVVKLRYNRKVARDQLALVDFYGRDPFGQSSHIDDF